MKTIKCATHNGVFHADEVLAWAIVQVWAALAGEKTDLVRTRDPKVLATCDLVFDVGGVNKYTPETPRWEFDHHQRGGAGVRPNGVPYAAAGLVWGHFGPLICQRLAESEHALSFTQTVKLLTSVDELCIAPVDAADNGFELSAGWRVEGIKPLTFSGIVSGYNPTWWQAQSEQHTEGCFALAANFAQTVLWRCIDGLLYATQAANIVRAAQRPQPEVLLLEQQVPWQEALLGDAELAAVQFVVYKQPGEASTTWMCQAVPDKLGSFGKRKALPASWGGLRNADEVPAGTRTLAEETGVADAVFCHPGLFICGASSKEGALALAALAARA